MIFDRANGTVSNAPARTKVYVGPITDTRIWDAFKLRADDIILRTPPKCGTTWSQAILMMLIESASVTDRPVWRESLWLDCRLGDQVSMKEAIDAQTGCRCIKSHTPLDGIPFDPQVTYITVYRHPIDVHVSLEKQAENMVSDVLDFFYPKAPGAAFHRFLAAPATDCGTDDQSLASIMHHFQSFAQFAHLPNVHMFHYSDLSSNLPATIEHYASAIAVTCPHTLSQSIAEAAAFGVMRTVTAENPRAAGTSAFADDTKFFDSATSGKWKRRLSASQLDDYRRAIATLATPTETAWLENGAASGVFPTPENYTQ